MHLHGDFGLPDVRIGLESTAFLMGAPLAKLQWHLEGKKGLTAQADLRRLEQLGHLESDFVSRKGCGHPRRPCLLQYFAGESEEVHRGARIHLLSGEHAKRTLETCKMLVTDNPLLGQMKTGALVRLRKHFFKSQSQPCSLKMDPVHLTQESQQKRRSRPLSLFSGEAENLS